MCKSGKALFGQYRLLKSVTGEQEAPLITLLNEGALTGMGVDDGLAEQMNDVILNWRIDVDHHGNEVHQRMVTRHNKKWGHE